MYKKNDLVEDVCTLGIVILFILSVLLRMWQINFVMSFIIKV